MLIRAEHASLSCSKSSLCLICTMLPDASFFGILYAISSSPFSTHCSTTARQLYQRLESVHCLLFFSSIKRQSRPIIAYSVEYTAAPSPGYASFAQMHTRNRSASPHSTWDPGRRGRIYIKISQIYKYRWFLPPGCYHPSRGKSRCKLTECSAQSPPGSNSHSSPPSNY